jgi:peptide deformylase
MALLPILEYPDPRLRRDCARVEHFDASLSTLIDDMFETMYAAPGVGLAAIQVNRAIQLIVIDVSEEKNAPLVLVNPEIVSRAEPGIMKEGCLSVPGFYEDVARSHFITVNAQDRKGKAFTLEARDLLAVCIQHEMDHLSGKLFVDYLSELKRNRIRSKLEKEHRSRRPAEPVAVR